MLTLIQTTYTKMKHAIIVLYVVVGLQAVFTITALAVSYTFLQDSFEVAFKSFSEQMILVLDQRYVLK